MAARKSVGGVARLVLQINRATYVLRRLAANPAVANPVWRLVKMDGRTFYDVHGDQHGFSCTCGDYVFRRQHEKKKCKHVEALRAVGLLPNTPAS